MKGPTSFWVTLQLTTRLVDSHSDVTHVVFSRPHACCTVSVASALCSRSGVTAPSPVISKGFYTMRRQRSRKRSITITHSCSEGSLKTSWHPGGVHVCYQCEWWEEAMVSDTVTQAQNSFLVWKWSAGENTWGTFHWRTSNVSQMCCFFLTYTYFQLFSTYFP